ncbi:Nitrilase [Chytriomyces hyalinus]|nr:Nitrilase [Chytriomyces hyalinus]
MPRFCIAAVQDAPVAFDLEASLSKLEALTVTAAEAARSQPDAANLALPVVVVFPEAFLSAYPRDHDFGARIGSRTDEGRAWFRKYIESAVPVSDVEGPIMSRIRAAARNNNVVLVVGVVERCDGPVSGPERGTYGSSNKGGFGTLYCTSLTISNTGELLSVHRKLMPTASERLVWGQGDGADIRVVDTIVGRVGGCICWENYMPMQRMALYSMGVEVYVAPTADSRESWTSTMRHIASEGRCFVVGCNQYAERQDYPGEYPGLHGMDSTDVVTLGGSVIVGPLGNVLAGPLFGERGILCAVVDKDRIHEAKMDFDPVGHYARPDVFKLVVDTKSKPVADLTQGV